ncbi:MAG: ABC transporter substrate-binding protein, partial [Gammaproteobacteria bacterium]
MPQLLRLCFLVFVASVAACSDPPWNNPYPETESGKNIYYDSFSERPKHLDPVSSYSSNEYVFLGQIYEPPLQYHFLKRPYELIPLTGTEVPEPVYLNQEGRILTGDAAVQDVFRSRYRITIRPGILYQPHPAFAKAASGEYLYHELTEEYVKRVHTLSDFEVVGTRELTANDYVYQIKRMAHPRVHSPIAGLMGKYILGLEELTSQLAKEYSNQAPEKISFIDLRNHDLEGVKAIDTYTFEITLKEKYPQFLYWLSMSFFAPMPWEADYFYSQAGMADRNITLDWYPVGTGPYMLAENNPNRHMLLKRNPNFR